MDENNNVYSNYITTDTTSATTMMNMTMQVDDNELDGEEIKQIWNMTMQDDFYEHEHGEEIKQIWNLRFVIFAYLVAFSSAYAAVHLLDHGLWFWRSKELKNSAIIKHPDVYAACILGLGTVWCMHFVGMSAVTLEDTPMCYNWFITLGSLGVVIVLMIAGVKVAGNDIFATPDRDKILDQVLYTKYISHREDPKKHKLFIMCFHKIHFLAIGSFLAASGAIVMHYTGMMAQRGPFQKEWNNGFIAASGITAVVICFVGFWIMFRLRWNIQELRLRFISAAVIALAVCGLHFLGMAGVTYYADNESTGVCKENMWESSSPNDWSSHQIIIIALAMAVLAVVVFVEIIINQELLMAYEVASKSSEIVSSLFPPQVRERLFAGGKSRLRSFLKSGEDATPPTEISDDEDDSGPMSSDEPKPIADLFTDTTIMFADIAGFTAWSSQREPSQVFTLLEKIYGAFDEISERHRVFKVETVGDCYVCVSGLPDPRKDHAVIMCKVARDCIQKMGLMTKKLEVKLGPDTTDLKIRVGLHSGPVTAGVLRGKSARFQIFGDTVNVASRMESTGVAGRIQVSTETAILLKNAGKDCWIAPRQELIMAKGKGELQTYWVNPETKATSSKYSTEHSSVGYDSARVNLSPSLSPKSMRLIKWNVETLAQLLKQIAASRHVGASSVGDSQEYDTHMLNSSRQQRRMKFQRKMKEIQSRRRRIYSTPSQETVKTIFDEVQDYISLPEINLKAAKIGMKPHLIELDNAVMSQLHDFVSTVAANYRDNAFHNFEHASHVTMSISKMLSRIVAPSDMECGDCMDCMAMSQTLHDFTYGITSDPLTQFACVLSGLIHDVDHSGVPNTTLSKEYPELANNYKGRSIAEQNSVDVAFEILMDDHYQDLRNAIYSTDDELRRFRQVVVNAVLATDIADKELKALRNARWEKAFSEKAAAEDPQATTCRKATIVIEHMIQASDVAHTMQHWHVYTKWNERLFREMMEAWKSGRADSNPADGWYEGELGFFDFYIIPLAKKLKECGVFGVSSDEMLNYAVYNRGEWAQRGKEIVAEMVERCNDIENDERSSNGFDEEGGIESEYCTAQH